MKKLNGNKCRNSKTAQCAQSLPPSSVHAPPMLSCVMNTITYTWLLTLHSITYPLSNSLFFLPILKSLKTQKLPYSLKHLKRFKKYLEKDKKHFVLFSKKLKISKNKQRKILKEFGGRQRKK